MVKDIFTTGLRQHHETGCAHLPVTGCHPPKTGSSFMASNTAQNDGNAVKTTQLTQCVNLKNAC